MNPSRRTLPLIATSTSGSLPSTHEHPALCRLRVPGTDTPAATRGFGLVFSDVEREGAASIMLFDAKGRSLGRYNAPVRIDAAGFSFVGVVFQSPIVAQVRITSGQRALGADVQDLSDGGIFDLVVMDDYLYGEPQEIW